MDIISILLGTNEVLFILLTSFLALLLMVYMCVCAHVSVWISLAILAALCSSYEILFSLTAERDGILSEAQWLLNIGLHPNSNSATKAIGYRQVYLVGIHIKGHGTSPPCPTLDPCMLDGDISQFFFIVNFVLVFTCSLYLLDGLIQWFLIALCLYNSLYQAMEYLIKCRLQGGQSSVREFFDFLYEFQKASRYMFFF